MDNSSATPAGPTRGADVTSPAGATLSWSHELSPKKGLVIRAEVKNTGAADIFVLAYPWALDKSSQKAVDAEGIYRFERDKDLRLLLGAAPLPRRASVLFRLVPHAARVKPGATLAIERAVPLPIKEYSPYFPEEDDKAYREEHVERAHLMVQIIPDKPGLVVRPSGIYPAAVEIESPVAALADAKLLVSEAPAALAVMRRTDAFDRVVLPGEAQEPL